VLFVGDAGGFVNAFTAEGIFYGMVSGELAGAAIAESRTVAEAGRRYDRLWQREMGAELRDSVFIQRYLFGKHERVDRLVRLGNIAGWFSKAVIDYTAGHRSYRQVRRSVMLETPVKAAGLLLNLIVDGLKRSASKPPHRDEAGA